MRNFKQRTVVVQAQFSLCSGKSSLRSWDCIFVEAQPQSSRGNLRPVVGWLFVGVRSQFGKAGGHFASVCTCFVNCFKVQSTAYPQSNLVLFSTHLPISQLAINVAGFTL